jgi:hypothetical protein
MLKAGGRGCDLSGALELKRNAQAPFGPPDQRAFFLDGAEHEFETFGNGTRIGQLETGSADRKIDHFAIGDRQILVKDLAGFRRQSLGHETLVSTFVRHYATFTRIRSNVIDFRSCRKLKGVEEGPAACGELRTSVFLDQNPGLSLVGLPLDSTWILKPGARCQHAASPWCDETSRGGDRSAPDDDPHSGSGASLGRQRSLIANAPGCPRHGALTASADSAPKGPSSHVKSDGRRGSIAPNRARP